MSNIFSKEKGLTLIEILLAVALMGIVLGAGYGFFNSGVRTYMFDRQQVEYQQKLREIASDLVNQIRYATHVRITDDETILDDNEKFNYIYNQDKKIVQRLQQPTGINIDRFLMEDISDNPILKFERDQDHSRVVKLEIGNQGFSYETSVYLENLQDTIVGDQGNILGYQNTVLLNDPFQFIDWNKFWHDLLVDSHDGSAITADDEDIEFSNVADGSELSLTMSGAGQVYGGVLFSELTDEYFSDIPADLDSFTIEIDAAVDNLNGGWGILLRGDIDMVGTNTATDFGYMFQFDPGADGFILRKIRDGNHVSQVPSADDVGVTMIDGPKFNLERKGYQGDYSPYQLTNDEFDCFQWDPVYLWNEYDDSWLERYTTVITVQTLDNNELLLRVHLVDENGNRSNEMLFGEFDRHVLVNDAGQGAVFEGRALDWDYFDDEGDYPSLPGDYIALRSWDNDGEHSTLFYEISLSGAAPAPLKTAYNNSTTELTVTFDEDLAGVLNDIQDMFVLADDDANVSNDPVITGTKRGSDDDELILELANNLGNGEYILDYTASETGLADEAGNIVEDFQKSILIE